LFEIIKKYYKIIREYIQWYKELHTEDNVHITPEETKLDK